MTKTIETQIAEARELMQHMITLGFGTEMRERQERRINLLKAQAATWERIDRLKAQAANR